MRYELEYALQKLVETVTQYVKLQLKFLEERARDNTLNE